MRNKVTCQLMGGLGNKLFQISHVLGKSFKYNATSIFPKYQISPTSEITHEYLNTIFKNLEFVDENDIFFTEISENSFEYSDLGSVKENSKYLGYFQSKKYWEEYEYQIQDLFQPDDQTKKQLFSKYPQLNNENTLSIHLRRSDYLNYPEIHPVVSIDYIKNAVNCIGDYSYVFIFSDDIDFAKKTFDLKNMIFVNEGVDYLELWLMSLCKNNIISNSTFSWWGCFLNKNPQKKIIAPSLWFGPKGPKENDIYEKSWTLVDVIYSDGYFVPKPMSKKHFITFGDSKFSGTCSRISEEAISSKFFDTVTIYNENDLDHSILSYCIKNNRGFGYWSWKPYVLKKHLELVNYGDIIIYCDAGCSIFKSGEKRYLQYLEFLDNENIDSVFFEQGYDLKSWSKMDLFEFFSDYNLMNKKILVGGIFLIKKTDKILSLIDEWNHICTNHSNLIDDSPSELPNDESFVENRHDQSVLSALVFKNYFFTIQDDETYKFHYSVEYPFNATRILRV